MFVCVNIILKWKIYSEVCGRFSIQVLIAGIFDTLFITACKLGYFSIKSPLIMEFK